MTDLDKHPFRRNGGADLECWHCGRVETDLIHEREQANLFRVKFGGKGMEIETQVEGISEAAPIPEILSRWMKRRTGSMGPR